MLESAQNATQSPSTRILGPRYPSWKPKKSRSHICLTVLRSPSVEEFRAPAKFLSPAQLSQSVQNRTRRLFSRGTLVGFLKQAVGRRACRFLRAPLPFASTSSSAATHRARAHTPQREAWPCARRSAAWSSRSRARCRAALCGARRRRRARLAAAARREEKSARARSSRAPPPAACSAPWR